MTTYCTSFIGISCAHKNSLFVTNFFKMFTNKNMCSENMLQLKLSEHQFIFFKNLNFEMENFLSNRIKEKISPISFYQLQSKVSYFEILVGEFLKIQWEKKEKTLKIFSDIIGRDTIFFIKEMDGIVYSDRLDWLLLYCKQNNKSLHINDTALLDAIFFQVILAPQTIFKECFRLNANQILQIVEYNDTIHVAVNSSPYIKKSIFLKEKSFSFLQQNEPALSNISINTFSTFYSFVSKFNQLFNLSKNKLDYYVLTQSHMNLSSSQVPNLTCIETSQCDLFNYLPVLVTRMMEPCIHSSEYYHALLLEKISSEKLVIISDIGFLHYLNAIAKVTNVNQNFFDHTKYIRTVLKSIKNFYRFKTCPEDYLIHRWEETIKFIRLLVGEYEIEFISDISLFELLICLPERTRKFRSLAKTLGKKVILPCDDEEFIFKTLLSLTGAKNKNILSSQEAITLINSIQPTYIAKTDDISFFNLFDAVQRTYFAHKSTINEIFNLSRLQMSKFAQISKKGHQQRVTDFLITLLTTEYLSFI